MKSDKRFQVGQRIVCTERNERAAYSNGLTFGKTYVVLSHHRWDDDYGWIIDLNGDRGIVGVYEFRFSAELTPFARDLAEYIERELR